MKPLYSHSVRQALEAIKPSENCLQDLMAFKKFIDSLESSSSKKTHYAELNQWSDPVYKFIHNMLDKYGFISGDVSANLKNADASFWFKIYSVMSNVTYSSNLKPLELVALHHCSAYDRNEALRKDIAIIIRRFIKIEPTGKYEYDVFYEESGETFIGSTKGDNQKHAIENFKNIFEMDFVKIKHLQRLGLAN